MEFKPEYYAALEVLARGGRTAEEVARELEIEVHEAESLLNTLMAYGLVETRERGLILRKTVYVLTERGWEALHKWREEVKSRLEKAAELRQSGRAEEADAILTPIGPALPLLLAMGLLDLSLYSAALGRPPPLPEDEEVEIDVEEEEL
ncbi:helix-turn-helix domain-containing protein [Pyrobaculum aerophilum]|uniref:Transcription regulator TrmB N-terminal domain-containing protein n=2 Tax=Pyrobaculum aerophilum TaxID=13773 RepID=Q8ZXB2_PYRAE|nr:helix-turn-helix domain-containing protein [Pyrobaculum aerophilum]AAL63437.1 conserved hypothetical protein [Pyrobaculum aerophilum str. IM2]MCX8135678.1 transcriptional regulator [Pyrobaculum aerophilum]HII45964.1 transcriptional regulator [Pyrobaculum aerophilum]